MGISYEKLFDLLESNDLKKYDLRRRFDISPTIVDRLVKNKHVNTSTLEKICAIIYKDSNGLLDCDIGDICEITDIEEVAETIIDHDEEEDEDSEDTEE